MSKFLLQGLLSYVNVATMHIDLFVQDIIFIPLENVKSVHKDSYSWFVATFTEQLVFSSEELFMDDKGAADFTIPQGLGYSPSDAIPSLRLRCTSDVIAAIILPHKCSYLQPWQKIPSCRDSSYDAMTLSPKRQKSDKKHQELTPGDKRKEWRKLLSAALYRSDAAATSPVYVLRQQLKLSTPI